MSDKKLTQSEIYKIRYHIYRKAGYSTAEARKMRSRKLDVEGLKLENGQVPYEHKTFKRLVKKINYSKKIYSSKTSNKKLSQTEIYKIRYHIYRKAGYSATEARKLRSRKLDIEDLRLKNGQVPIESKTFKRLVKNINYSKKIYSSKTSNKKLSQTEIYKIRYHIYRKAGYSATEARKLRSRKLDVEGLKLENGQVPYEHKTFKRLVKNIKDVNIFNKKIEDFRDYYNRKVVGDNNDTTYTSWGAITHDKRYKDRTARLVKELQDRHNLSVNQGYYMLYMMTTHGMSYHTAVSELLSSEKFETYKQSKTLKVNRKRKV